MNRAALVVLLLAALPACKSPASSTRIAATSSGAFTITHRSVAHFYSMPLLRGQALQDAVEHCKTLDKTMRVIEERPAEPPPASGDDRRFHLTFACD